MSRPRRSHLLGWILAALAGGLVIRLIAVVVGHYPEDFPPDFDRSEFLHGRERQFAGLADRWAFAAHVVSGPVTLGLGLILVATAWSGRSWTLHRRVGWAQAGCVLGLVAPSGLVMARHATGGLAAAIGLAGLALATANCVGLGVRAILVGRVADHRVWMGRTLALLSSAVVLRMLGGLGTVVGVTAPWYDPLIVWVSWLAPLAGFEGVRLRIRRAQLAPRRRWSAAARGPMREGSTRET